MAQFEIGQIVGEYEITGLVGSGGMGTVYRVRHAISDRVEAMKVLLANLRSSPELEERFLREIKIQASLSHPNIASLYTARRLDDQLLMFIEFVEGESLHDRMQRGAIELPESLGIIGQVLGALAYAHDRGVIHRDVKPRNILLDRFGAVKLTDFGIATSTGDKQITRPGMAVGSLLYMSPEQIKGGRGDARSDLYSTGLMLYELTTGQHAVSGDSDYAIMAAHLTVVPRPPIELRPTLPASLSHAIMRALEKDPAARFQTAHEFRAALGMSTATGLPAAPQPASETSATRLAPGSVAALLRGEATPVPRSATGTAPAWDAAELDRVRKEFASYIGPMARILVDRMARRARTVDELYALLAVEIPSDSDRARFLASRRRQIPRG